MNALRPHSLWNIDYFMVNTKKKQLLYLCLYAQNNLFEKKVNIDSIDVFKGDMEIDALNEVDVNDGMAWCDEQEMSPHSDKKHKAKNSQHLNNYNNNNNNNNNNNDNNMDHNANQMIMNDEDIHNDNKNEALNNNYGQQQQYESNQNQLHVMSYDNCLGIMPALERPSDL